MLTKTFTGKIVGRSGEVLFDKVEGWIWIGLAAGNIWRWEGKCTAISGEPIENALKAARGGSLVTDDGRKGTLFVSECSELDRSIQFTGSGKAPYPLPDIE